MVIKERAADVAERAAELSGKATYVSAVGTSFAGFTLNEIAVMVGIVATIVTAGVNWYYRAKTSRLIAARLKHDGVVIGDE